MKKGNYKNRFEQNSKPHNQDFSILPPLALLENYEEMAPGITQKLMEMMQAEQENRHKRQDTYFRNKRNAVRLGQLCNVLIVFLLLFAVTILSQVNLYLAGVVAVMGFGFLLIIHVMAIRCYFPEADKKRFVRGRNSEANANKSHLK